MPYQDKPLSLFSNIIILAFLAYKNSTAFIHIFLKSKAFFWKCLDRDTIYSLLKVLFFLTNN